MTKKSFLGFIMILTAFSAIAIEPTSAQPIPKPAVPEFNITLADHSYDIPATTHSTTDPYTNKTTITTTPQRHVENITIGIIIKNQPFPSTLNGNASMLYYNIQSKGHYGKEWYEHYTFVQNLSNSLPSQSNSQYTVLSLSRRSPGDEIDFQVEAILGYHHTYYIAYMIPISETTFYYETSGWSNPNLYNAKPLVDPFFLINRKTSSVFPK